MKTAVDIIYDAFLRRQLAEGLALADASDLLQLGPMAGDPPFRYLARFSCRGLARNLAGQIVEHDAWDIGIQFPPDYLRSPSHPAQILAFLGTGGRPDLLPWHPNVRDCFICLEITPGMSLTEILYGLFDVLTWRLYSTRDEGLNHAASQFARNESPHRFPVDRRPLKRRAGVTFAVDEIAAPTGVQS